MIIDSGLEPVACRVIEKRLSICTHVIFKPLQSRHDLISSISCDTSHCTFYYEACHVGEVCLKAGSWGVERWHINWKGFATRRSEPHRETTPGVPCGEWVHWNPQSEWSLYRTRFEPNIVWIWVQNIFATSDMLGFLGCVTVRVSA
jgi:hypothetical protein